MKNGETFALAGLWSRWRPQDGEPVETCTIVTTEANELLQRVHGRMPVILSPGDTIDGSTSATRIRPI